MSSKRYDREKTIYIQTAVFSIGGLYIKKDLYSEYSILNRDIICEHKIARIINATIGILHNHDGYELVLFLGGDVSILVESEAKHLERGDLILIPPYTFHGLHLSNQDDYERVVINIKESFFPQLNDEFTNLAACFERTPRTQLNVLHLDERALNEYLTIATKLEATIEDTSYGHRLLERAYLTELLIAINRQAELFKPINYSNMLSPVVKDIFVYVDSHPSENITVNSLADFFHMNPDYLNRLFKKTTGCPLKHFIIAKKISLAQHYLRQGYSPIDVCFMVGYSNYSSFSRRFLAQIGSAPKQYQLQALTSPIAIRD